MAEGKQTDQGQGPAAQAAEPRLSDKGRAERQARQERQAAALRENLHRRKAQVRSRQTSDDEGLEEEISG